jgi:hypothetical protein
MPSIREDPMTQVHVSDAVSDARNIAESVATQAAEYAGTVTDEVKSLAGDVAHEVAQRVRSGLDSHDPRAKARTKQARVKRSAMTRRLTWGLVFAAAGAVVVLAVRRSRRSPNAQSPPVTNLGPEIGTDSDVPGPAYDPAAATS